MSDFLPRKIIGQKKFCSAPFTSVYIGQYNDIRVCCASPTPIGKLSSEQSLKDIINSNIAKDIRKSLSNDKFHAACIHCKKIEEDTSRIANERRDNNYLGLANIENAVANTKEDGEIVNQHPVWLDILYSNKCNFACMGCSADLSSTIATKYQAAYNILNGKDENQSVITEWQNSNDKIIDYILQHQEHIKKIHLNGGEPFMQEPVHELLEFLIKHKLNKTIHIWSHTNGSISKYKSIDVIEDYLSNWGAKATITMSHDMHGSKGEYVRYGLKQDKWINTYNRLKEAKVEVNIQTCYNLFNALHLQDLYNFYRYDLNCNDHLILNAWNEPIAFSARMLQIDSNLHKQANDVIDNFMHKGSDYDWRQKLVSAKTLLNNKIDNDAIDLYKEKFKKSIIKFDELRNTSFSRTFPELKHLLEL